MLLFPLNNCSPAFVEVFSGYRCFDGIRKPVNHFGFGIGIITAMVIYTMVISRLSKMQLFSKSKSLLSNLRFYGGLAAIMVGIYWLVSNL